MSVTAAGCSRTGHIPWKSAMFPWEGRGTAGGTALVLVSEIVMCPRENLVQYAYSDCLDERNSHRIPTVMVTVPPPCLLCSPSFFPPFQASSRCVQGVWLELCAPVAQVRLSEWELGLGRPFPSGPGFPRHVSVESGLHLGLCLPIGSARNSSAKPLHEEDSRT